MSKTDEAAAKAIDKASQAADQIAAKMAELAQQYGPDVVNAAVEVARISAIQSLVPPVIALALMWTVAIVLFRFSRNLAEKYNKWRALYENERETRASVTAKLGYPEPDEILSNVTLTASLGLGFLSIFPIYAITNVWAWVGIFEPKLYIAHRVLEKLL
jgi:hypothetical protein